MKPAIAVIGTGRMGSALAGAFLGAGLTTHVWNRTAARLVPLTTRGALAAASVRDAAAAADIIVVNVSDYAAADLVLRVDAVIEALRGKTLVQLTGGSPRQARDTAAWAHQHGIGYLDGAIMATPDLVGTDHCTVLYSGSRALFDTHASTLRALGSAATFVGDDAGHASTLDVALLTCMWGSLFGALHGVSVIQAEQFPVARFVDSIRPMLPLINTWTLDVIERIRDGRLNGDEQTPASIDTHHGSLLHLLEICRDRGIHAAVPDAFDGIFRRAIAAGRGKDDFAALDAFMR